MGELLNFNPSRNLEFDSSRSLEFDVGRSLSFDAGRPLEFHPNRDLGFGHRGIVFRGYVCPICGALVAEDAPQCAECGTVFDRRPRASAPPVPTASPAPPKEGARAEPWRAQREAPPLAETPATRTPSPPPRPESYCAYCGAKLHRGDAFCWNCGARSAGATEAVKLPSQKAERVTREWK